ncbi:Rhodanese-like protein [Cystobasidium minutum MCA 4210]|uniref:Rhodanese-like protein n=1 Tax=Cystobasidium minutum MCA 4210 TaxID=1397322 RepID=UPI0034CE80AB|eukprot:jgi/Rhomi1/170126/fgenesh1_kg.3_\
MVRFTYADSEEVVDIVKSGKAGKDFLVVDVRDDDFVGGNITGAKNVPSAQFNDRIEDLIAETRDVPKVIFHCALSQVRGPKMARIYAEAAERHGNKVELAFEKETAKKDDEEAVEQSSKVEDTTKQKPEKPEQEVIVLRGGFTRWQEKYKNDPQLVENWKASIWASAYD